MTPATLEILTRLNGLVPKLALVLGSGLGDLVDNIDKPVEIPFGELPGFRPFGQTCCR